MIIRQVGLILLLSLLSFASFGATQYGLNETDWRVADNNPAGATVGFAEEPLLDRAVVITSGAARSNSYMVGGTNASSGWNNTAEHIISWNLKTTENANVFVRVDTALGWRYIYYNQATKNNGLNSSGRYIHNGLGASFKDGQWHTWSRDLAADLVAAEPGNQLLAVNGVVIRGSVQIDGITLSADNIAPQSVITTTQYDIAIGDELTLDSQDSIDPDGAVYEYIWRNASGTVIGNATKWQGVITDSGTHDFSLEIVDNFSQSAITTVSINAVDVSQPTVYSDAEGGTLHDWRVADKTPEGASVLNVADPDNAQNRVIQTAGTGTQNSFILGNTNPTRGWNNTLQTNITWRSKADENFRVYVRVTTPAGWRYLWYDSRSIDVLENANGNYIHHGLGTDARDGQWHTYTRDLLADLQVAQPDNTITGVHAMIIRGSVLIDDVALLGDVEEPPPPPPPPVPVTPVNVSPVVDTQIELGATQTFTWEAQSVAQAYDFHLFDSVSTDLTLINEIDPATACDANTCSLDVAIELPVHDSHAWRVRAKNTSGISSWSRSEFDVVEPLTSSPLMPVITRPANDESFAPEDFIVVQWQADASARTYDFGIYDPATDTTTYNPAYDALDICTVTTCTLSKQNDLPIADGYVFRIRANNRLGSSDWSEVSINIAEPITTPPAIPSNISPDVGVQLVEGREVEFSWSASELAASYDFHFFDNVSKGLQFSNDLSAEDYCSENICRFTTSVNLPVFNNHAWRVSASNAAGKSNWTRSVFDVIPVPDLTPATPVNVLPAVNAVLTPGSTQLFNWEPVGGAQTYDFHLYDVIEGESPFVIGLNANDICDASLCEYQTDIMSTVAIGHAWRVRAVNEEGTSAWSRSEFTVRDQQGNEPLASFTASTVFGPAPLLVNVDASNASDVVGITDYQWDFAGLNNIQGPDAVTASHEFLLPGNYTITLTVSNAAGLTDTASIEVTVTEGMPANAPSKEEAARLLAQASFGASSIAIQQVRQLGIEGWIDAQLQLQGPDHLDYVTSYSNGSNRDARHEIWWLDAVDGEDQLRQRVAFALSQLLVVSDVGFTLGNAQYGVTNYYDILRKNAFGNYRELLEQVTLNPVMGIYLSMLQNDKGSPTAGTRADENYAREVLQLFSIGLHNLNIDGSRSGGNTFTQDQIENFARVFTGWNYKNAGQWDRRLFTGQDLINPMEAFEDRHDTDAKTLLNGMVIPAGQTARADLEMALDNIYAHQNLAPFVSMHLIKQLVTSNPSPAYISRVASVFNNNGNGVKGDLAATVKAILMDAEARNPQNLQGYGKLREPVLRLSHLWRAFSVTQGNQSVRGEYNTYSPALRDLETITGQAVLRSSSVFNFFSPSHSPSGPVQNAQLVAPEFEILTDTNMLSTASRINSQIHRHYKQNPTSSELNPSYLDFATEIELAENPQALLDHLSLLLLSGDMPDALNNVLLSHLQSLPDNDTGYRLRVQDAISLMVASPEYLVQK